MKLNFILLPIITFLIACSGKEQSNKNIDKSSMEKSYFLDSLDYEIISQSIYQYLILPPSLGHRFENFDSTALTKRIEGIKSFVLVDSTFIYNPGDSLDFEKTTNWLIKKHSEIDSSDVQMIHNIWTINKTISSIDSASLTCLKFRVAPSETIKSVIYNNDYGWNKFYTLYPGPSLLIHVSIPVYNNSKDKALIYVDYLSSPKSGAGGFLWLIKEKNRWIAYDLVEVWIA